MEQIFISYSRKNETFARELAKALSAAMIEIWIDVENIPAGINWSDAIQQGLDASDIMILIISPDSMASQQVKYEWQYFLDNNKPLIPILHRETKDHFQLARLQYINFLSQDFDIAFGQLCSEIQAKRSNQQADTPVTNQGEPIPEQKSLSVKASDRQLKPAWIMAILAVIIVVVLILVVLSLTGLIKLPSLFNTATPTHTPTATSTPTTTATPTHTSTPTFTPTPTRCSFNLAECAPMQRLLLKINDATFVEIPVNQGVAHQTIFDGSFLEIQQVDFEITEQDEQIILAQHGGRGLIHVEAYPVVEREIQEELTYSSPAQQHLQAGTGTITAEKTMIWTVDSDWEYLTIRLYHDPPQVGYQAEPIGEAILLLNVE